MPETRREARMAWEAERVAKEAMVCGIGEQVVNLALKVFQVV